MVGVFKPFINSITAEHPALESENRSEIQGIE